MTDEKKPKVIFSEKIKCPHCSKSILVKKTKKVVSEPVPAEYEEDVIVEKDNQTKL